ncbi:hypothetical protein COT99_03650 [Candidatus Falkowbacteria bacterium CG10_big_fil_rev_8_21_14_0_10_43_10]|uniref:Antitoxin n=1 Tax=Candidatus Falkowbacteria bacterium CG10_big_fil_rev_8_21_14_0_10_43_10 TaxID=1974567 RepID=A0A2H0V1H8_9BACT|nr:MAG: hypothetical protein COT99_03650 [Candidatus Falkowbacteria bacterium CG10_big_fil_rev_8_21_14_0_10_43_10]
MQNVVGLKELRENVAKYARKVAQGESFIIFKQSKPLFKITPIDEENWEEVVDFTKLRKGGINVDDILSRL